MNLPVNYYSRTPSCLLSCMFGIDDRSDSKCQIEARIENIKSFLSQTVALADQEQVEIISNTKREPSDAEGIFNPVCKVQKLTI